MKKLLIFIFLALFCTSLSALRIYNSRLVYSRKSCLGSQSQYPCTYTGKDSLGYIVIAKAGGVHDTIAEIDTMGNIALNGDVKVTAGLTVVDSINATTGIWWYCKYIDGHSFAPGASAATWVAPSLVGTVGGFQLNAIDEYLYFNGGICNNWYGGDLEVKVTWELNAASVAADDTVEIDLLCYYKSHPEDTVKYQALSCQALVGNESRYTMHVSTFTIDWDLANNVVQAGDKFSFRLNLDTGNSDIDDVIINRGNFRYLTDVPQPKNY